MRAPRALGVVALGLLGGAGGGEADLPLEGRRVPADVAIHPGYRIEVVATDLTYPSTIPFEYAVEMRSLYEADGARVSALLDRLGPRLCARS